MSETNGGSTGPVSTFPSELDAAREDWRYKRARAEDLWTAYQKAKGSRASWQAAEVDAIIAGKRYAEALRAAEEACEGQRGG